MKRVENGKTCDLISQLYCSDLDLAEFSKKRPLDQNCDWISMSENV